MMRTFVRRSCSRSLRSSEFVRKQTSCPMRMTRPRLRPLCRCGRIQWCQAMRHSAEFSRCSWVFYRHFYLLSQRFQVCSYMQRSGHIGTRFENARTSFEASDSAAKLLQSSSHFFGHILGICACPRFPQNRSNAANVCRVQCRSICINHFRSLRGCL